MSVSSLIQDNSVITDWTIERTLLVLHETLKVCCQPYQMIEFLINYLISQLLISYELATSKFPFLSPVMQLSACYNLELICYVLWYCYDIGSILDMWSWHQFHLDRYQVPNRADSFKKRSQPRTEPRFQHQLRAIQRRPALKREFSSC